MAAFVTGHANSAETSPDTTPSFNAGYFDNTKFSTPNTSRAPSVTSEEAARPTPYRSATDAIPARQCGRCRQEFPGDPSLGTSEQQEWWLCPPCREALVGRSGPRP